MSVGYIGALWSTVSSSAATFLVLPGVGLATSAANVITRPIGDLRNMLDSLGRAETTLRESRAALMQLASVGIVMEDDVVAFNTLRANLFAAQTRIYRTILVALTNVPVVGADISRRIPPPQMTESLVLPRGYVFAPKGTFPDTLPFVRRLDYSGPVLEAVPSSAGTSGLRGGAAGLGLAPAAWAAIVIGVLAGVGVLVWLLRGSTDEAARNVVPEAQAAVFNSMVTQRRLVYEDCVTSGSTRPECAAIAQAVVPDAPDLSVQARERAREEQAKAKNTGYIVLGIGVVLVGFLLLRGRGRGAARESIRVTPPARRLQGLRGPRRVRDLHGPSAYNLEIE